ncbi:MAG: alpha/beta hydrolase [bacterium]
MTGSPRCVALTTLVVLLAVAVGAAATPLDPAAGAFLDANLDSLTRRAFEAYQQGEYLEAARRYLDLLRHDITNAPEIYNLACCYGLLGEPELAARYLVRAFRAGYRDVDHARRDPDFEPVSDKAVFRRALDSLARAAEDRDLAAGTRILIPARNFYECRVRLPLGHDPQRRYPLVIGLHGYGSDHESFGRLWERFGADPQFIFACPQAPYLVDLRGTGLSWSTAADSATRPSVITAAEEYILDVVRLLSGRHRVSDVYLFGFSQGAGMAYAAGIRHPRHFKGIACFGGALDTTWVSPAALESGKSLRVFIAHGREDRVVEHYHAVRARDLLRRAGFDVTDFDFDGGHQVPPVAARRFADWLGPAGPKQPRP